MITVEKKPKNASISVNTDDKMLKAITEFKIRRWEHKLFGIPVKKIHTLVPGILLLVVFGYLATFSSKFIGENLLGFAKSPISSVMLVLIIGMLIGNLFRSPNLFKPGLQFGMNKLLRLGIILLGIRLSLSDVFKLSAISFPIILLCISTAILVTSFLIKKLKQPKRLGTLIAVGTSICGVSAIVATSPVIDADEEETAYAVAVITVFGLMATIIYPILAYYLFQGDAVKAGLWLGTSIQDTSQVTGAAMVYSELWDAAVGLDIASVTKLVRNIFMVFHNL